MWESVEDFDNCHRMVSVKMVLRDLDLLFEGHNFKILISLKRYELAKKCVEVCRFLVFAIEW